MIARLHGRRRNKEMDVEEGHYLTVVFSYLRVFYVL